MTEKLLYYIKQTGLNFKQFASKANIPYTTLMSVIQRGVENSGVNTMFKICDALGITIEDLLESAPLPESKTSITMIARGDGKKEFKVTKEKGKVIESLLEQLTDEEDNN